MKDDAVAPVIAVMLILAAIVTFLSIWNAVYIPSMKQSSEAEHLQNVESAFLHFSSDIEKAVSSHQDSLSFSEPVQLGGGDCMFNNLRSGGSLEIRNNNPVYTIKVYNQTDHMVSDMKGTLVNISFEPVNNFWQDQGYQWQYGFINVTKYRTLKTPLGYYNMTDVNNEFEGSGSLLAFAKSFGIVGYTVNQSGQFVCNNLTEPDDYCNKSTNWIYQSFPGNCSSLELRAVNITASPNHRFVSSNGAGTLKLKTTVSQPIYLDANRLEFASDNTPFGNGTLISWNTNFQMINETCPNNIIYTLPEDGMLDITIRQDISPVNVSLTLVNIEVGAY